MMGRMGRLADVYALPLALLTDLYQLTMAEAYESTGARAERGGVPPLLPRATRSRAASRWPAASRAPSTTSTSYRFGDDDLAYLATLTGNDGQPLFEPSFLRQLAGIRLGLRRRRHARGDGGVPPRAAGARARSAAAGPARRDGSAQFRQLRDADRDQGGARDARRARRRGDRVRAAARAGRRRRAVGDARGLRGRRQRDLERARGPAAGAPGARHPRAQLGDGLRRRDRGLPGLGPRAAQQRRLPGRHLRHARRRSPRREGRGSSCRRAGTGRSGSASTRATSPT